MDRAKAINNMYKSLTALRSNVEVYKESYIKKKVQDIPINMLIMYWKKERDIDIKERIEILIAKKLNSYNLILQYNNVPNIFIECLNKFTSIDAIVELLSNSNEEIKKIASNKYKEFFDNYLEKEEKYKIIKFRGVRL